MKIGLLGTSPAILILANHFSDKGCDITIFETSKKIGGAWAYYKFKDHYISTQTNVLVPGTKLEEKNIPTLNKYFKNKLSVKIHSNNLKFEPIGYLAKKNYEYELNYLYQKIKKNKKIKFKRKFVKNLKTSKSGVVVNNKEKFNKFFLPTFAGVKKIVKFNKVYKIDPRVIVSQHLLLIAKKINVKKTLSYSENFDDNFDRMQKKKLGKFEVFTARVRKDKKGKNILNLIMNSKLLSSKKDLIRIVKTKYKNYFRDNEEREKLKKICKNTNIEYVDTGALAEAFFIINKKFKLIKIKKT